jgi:hypothetical protein
MSPPAYPEFFSKNYLTTLISCYRKAIKENNNNDGIPILDQVFCKSCSLKRHFFFISSRGHLKEIRPSPTIERQGMTQGGIMSRKNATDKNPDSTNSLKQIDRRQALKRMAALGLTAVGIGVPATGSAKSLNGVYLLLFDESYSSGYSSTYGSAYHSAYTSAYTSGYSSYYYSNYNSGYYSQYCNGSGSIYYYSYHCYYYYRSYGSSYKSGYTSNYTSNYTSGG